MKIIIIINWLMKIIQRKMIKIIIKLNLKLKIIPDTMVLGWQVEYTNKALEEATLNNNKIFTLPKLSRKIELGIKHATQRMVSENLYPLHSAGTES